MICIINARLIDNVETESYLASLILDCSISEIDYFFDCRVVKIVRQIGVISKHDYASFFSVNSSNDNYVIDKVVDFSNDYIFPSFVDFHCHSEFLYLNNPLTTIRQKDLISDEVVGNCGVSIYPIIDDKFLQLKQNVLSILGDWPEDLGKWNDFLTFYKIYKNLNIKNNLLFLQGHSALRIAAIDGNPNKKASKKEVIMMQKYLDECLSSGAIGFSTGLYYAPCVFADSYEIDSLLEIVRKHNALFAIHRREEGNKGFESTQEAINHAKKTKVRLQISHLKAIGDSNQNQVDLILREIDNAYNEGLDVAFDQYPYVYGSTSLSSLLPPFVLRDGERVYKEKLKNDTKYRNKAKELMLNPNDFESIAQLVRSDKIFIQYSDTFPDYISKSIFDIANEKNTEPIDVILDILSDEEGVCTMKDVTQSEENLVKIMSHPLSLFGTDSLYAGKKWHDRSLNASRYMLKKYSKIVGIENLVRRATLKSAKRLQLKDKKIVKEGVDIKLVRFSL